MNPLKSTLTAFSQAIRNPKLTPTKGLSTTTTSNISAYRRNHLYALLAVLQERYPVVEKFLSEDNFKFFAREYIYCHPSNDPNIDNYGKQFAEFIQTRSELRNYIYLADLARLDDLFYQAQGHCQVATGVLSVWQAIRDDTSTANLEISPHELCVVAFEQRTDELCLLQQTSN